MSPSPPGSTRAKIDYRHRVSPRDLPELMDGDCSYEQFRDCLLSLEQVNRWLLGYRPTLAWLDRLPTQAHQPIHILDVGSGGGGLLRRIATWAGRRGIPTQLTGIDLNPYAAQAAAEFTPQGSRIAWITGNALTYRPENPANPENPIQIVVSSLTAHHLENDEIVTLLRWMESTAEIGWFINDLERSERSSRMFGWLAALARWHPFVRHDGPVSFRRAFRRQDWLQLLAAAGVPPEAVTIENWRPGRLCVGRWK
jgi:SAM-dependent methyltransferase